MKLDADRIAVVKLGAIGDVVNTLPFVCRLRDARPAARITWVIAPPAHALVRGHRAVDEFLVLDVHRPAGWPGFLRSLRARRIELALDLSRLLKSGLVTLATGAPLRVGFDRARSKEWSHLFTNRRIPANPAPGVTVEQYLEFGDYLELPAAPVRYDLPDEPWDGAPPQPGVPRICVNVGASKPANRWRPERFAELCELLANELGAELHLTGGPSDRPAAERVRAALRAPFADQVGRLSLKRTAGLLRSADLCISCDTGPLHVAVAVGTPVVALFGASNPARTAPFGAPRAVVSRPAPCSPCRRRHCNVPGHPCMEDIEARAVFERARDVLARSRQEGRARSGS